MRELNADDCLQQRLGAINGRSCLSSLHVLDDLQSSTEACFPESELSARMPCRTRNTSDLQEEQATPGTHVVPSISGAKLASIGCSGGRRWPTMPRSKIVSKRTCTDTVCRSHDTNLHAYKAAGMCNADGALTHQKSSSSVDHCRHWAQPMGYVKGLQPWIPCCMRLAGLGFKLQLMSSQTDVSSQGLPMALPHQSTQGLSGRPGPGRNDLVESILPATARSGMQTEG